MKRWLLLPLVIGACHKDPGPSCAKITDHMLDVTKQSMPGHDPTLLGDRKGMIATCEKRNPSREVRNCLMNAKSLSDLGACQAGAKPATSPAPAPAPAPPAPAPAAPDPTPPPTTAPPSAPSGTAG